MSITRNLTYTQPKLLPEQVVKSTDWSIECSDSETYPNGLPVPLVGEGINGGFDWRETFEKPELFPNHVIEGFDYEA